MARAPAPAPSERSKPFAPTAHPTPHGRTHRVRRRAPRDGDPGGDDATRTHRRHAGLQRVARAATRRLDARAAAPARSGGGAPAGPCPADDLRLRRADARARGDAAGGRLRLRRRPSRPLYGQHDTCARTAQRARALRPSAGRRLTGAGAWASASASMQSRQRPRRSRPWPARDAADIDAASAAGEIRRLGAASRRPGRQARLDRRQGGERLPRQRRGGRGRGLHRRMMATSSSPAGRASA